MYDLVYSYFFATRPEMVREMEAAMQVLITGVRYTSVSFDCVADEDNSPINDFTISNQTSENIHVSKDGMVTLAHHRHGQFKFTVKSAQRIDKEVTVIIKPRINNHFTVRLQK
jgi:xanthine dehydrogenase molybdopterin-binding subunit B